MIRTIRKWLFNWITWAVLFSLLIAWIVILYIEPIRAILLSIWGASVAATVCYVRRHIHRVYETHWFDSSNRGRLTQPRWSEIDALIRSEPLDHETDYRYPNSRIVPGAFVLLVLVLFFSSTLTLILHFDQADPVQKGIETLAFPAAGLALIGTILTVFYQVRLTARTKNRNEWIESIRKKMTDLISKYDANGNTEPDHLIEVKRKITELELLLNPGERIHRTFLTLIRKIHGIENDYFDNPVKSRLPTIFSQSNDDKADQPDPVGPNPWITRATRLSNVILKNEWERVKHAE